MLTIHAFLCRTEARFSMITGHMSQAFQHNLYIYLPKYVCFNMCKRDDGNDLNMFGITAK